MEFQWCILFFLFTGLVASSPASFSFSSDPIFATPSPRKVLESNPSCRIIFDSLNYTIITSKCRGPPYPIDRCCQAFKEFACPFKDHHVNDASGTCTDIMLDSIARAGNYPINLFSNECLLQEDRQGLECDADAPGEAVSSDSKNEAATLSRQILLVLFLILVLVQ